MLYKTHLLNWLASRKPYLKQSTYAVYSNIIHSQLIPVLGALDTQDLTDELVQDFILERSQVLSWRYAKDILMVIQFTLDRHIDAKLPYHQPTPIQIFERDDLLKLSTYLHQHVSYKNFGILLAIHTGLRIGELCALRWPDFSLASRTITISKTMIRTYTKEDGSRLNITPPKSRSSQRVIPLNQFVVDYAALLDKSEDGYILTNTNQHIEPNKLRLYYNRLLAKLALPHLKFHCLRHTFATRCIEAGCDYKSLSELLGHSSPAITMNLYIHPQMELKRKCVELLADYYR